jgi:DNA invertase Pin-like site-specific DNA recombinase
VRWRAGRTVQKSRFVNRNLDLDFPATYVVHIICAKWRRNGQSLDAQLGQLKGAGCTKIFREKISGARADRPELAKLLKARDAGDVVIVTRLDRLARSTRDLLNVLASIGDRKAGFRSLGDTWANTTTPHGRLMLTVLGGLAEFERELIRARTGEGRARAIARGVKLGRNPKLTPHQKREAVARREAGETVMEIARTYNVSHSTISRARNDAIDPELAPPCFATLRPSVACWFRGVGLQVLSFSSPRGTESRPGKGCKRCGRRSPGTPARPWRQACGSATCPAQAIGFHRYRGHRRCWRRALGMP